MSKPSMVGVIPLGGGMTIGLEQAGFEAVRNFEIQGYGANLEHNRPNVPTHYASPSDLSAWEEWAESQAEDPPTLVYGSPPCQGFSGMNSRSGPDAAKNDWLLHFTRTAMDLKCDYAIAENIPRSLSLGRKIVNEMSDLARRGGYGMSIHRHNIWDFGVSQQRRRVMFVFERRGKELLWPEPQQREKSEAMPVWDAISDLEHMEPTVEHDAYQFYPGSPRNPYQASLRSPHSTTNNHQLIMAPERYEHVPHGRQWLAMPEEYMTEKDLKRIREGTIFNAVETKRLHPERVGPTLTGAINLLHPFKTRYITVREASRIMAFPDDWEWLIPRNYQQMAAGVCPPVAKWFGDALMANLAGTPMPVGEGLLF